jgi:hypothetical protein
MSKKEDIISVEMTQAQKDKVVDLFAQEKAKAEKKFVTMNLMYQHKINGTKYGRGVAKVPEELAGHLQAADHKAMVARLKENISTNTELEILSRGISRVIRQTEGV